MKQRTEKITGQFERLEVDAFLVTCEVNVRYLSGFTGDSSYLLIRPESTTILTDGRYETQIAAECPSLEAAVRPPSQPLIDLVGEVIGDGSVDRVGIEASHLTVDTMRRLEARLPDVRWVETSGEVERLRSVKEPEEIAIIRRAASIAERAFRSVTSKLTSRWTEREIAFELEATMRVLGADGVSFSPIVAVEPSGALPHYRPEDVRLAATATLLIDWGASYQGYASDITRTLHRPPASEEFRHAYEAVLESQLAAIEAIRPGAETREVDAVARGILEKAGLGPAFKHGLGHGIGLEIHEAPRLGASSDETLQPGMVVTVEPGVYLEGRFGIRIEDDVLVTESGHEVLTRLGKGLDDCRLIL